MTSIKDYIKDDDDDNDEINGFQVVRSKTILDKNFNSNEFLVKQLNEEKNKNKKLINELNNEKKKVKELTNKIKELEKNFSNNNNINRINELEKIINKKDKEIKNLQLKFEKNDLINTKLDEGDIIAVNFTSTNGDINFPIACKPTNIIARLEEKIYNEYPEYKDYQTYLMSNEEILKRFKTIEENGIKNGNQIMVIRNDED